jgi:hypothetical protein
VPCIPNLSTKIEVDGGLLAPGNFTPMERDLSANWTGGWVDPRLGLDAVMRKISCPTGN